MAMGSPLYSASSSSRTSPRSGLSLVIVTPSLVAATLTPRVSDDISWARLSASMSRMRSIVMFFLWSFGITCSYGGNCASMSLTAMAMSSWTRNRCGVLIASLQVGPLSRTFFISSSPFLGMITPADSFGPFAIVRSTLLSR